MLEEKLPKDASVVSLSEKDIYELPDRLEFPKVKLRLLLKNYLNLLQISDTFFELKVLDLTKFHLLSLPSSLQLLTKLQTLCLDQCVLGDIATIGNLTKLEVLSLLCSDIEQLLGEIRQLTRLRLLDRTDCPRFKTITPGVYIGDVWDWSGNYGTSRALKLKWSNSIYLDNRVKPLLNGIEDLYLDELNCVKNVLYELNGEGFPQLKNLYVRNGLEIQYIINSVGLGTSSFCPRLESLFLYNLINLDKICHGQLALESFNKLRIVKVGKCDRLKHLFSFSMANNLSQLQEIEVTICKKLQEIICEESEEQVHQNERISRIEFTQLRTLTLQSLPWLIDFGFKAFTSDIGSHEILAEDEHGVFIFWNLHSFGTSEND